MENKQDIGKAFKDRLSGLHREPGDAVWQNISASLQQQKRGGFRMPLWGKATSIIAVVALVALFTYPQWQQYVPQVTITMPGEETPGTGSQQPETGNQNPGSATQDAVTSTGEADSEAATPGTLSNPEAITNAEQTANAAQRSQGSSAANNQQNGYTNTTTASPSGIRSSNQRPTHNTGFQTATNANTAVASQNKTTNRSANNSNAYNKTSQNSSGTSATSNTAATATGTTTSGQTNNAGSYSLTGVAATASQTAVTGTTSAATQKNATTQNDTAGQNSAATRNAMAAQNNGATTANTQNTAKGYAKNLDANMMYSAGNFPTINKAMADSLMLAQKKLDEEKSRERTYAQPAFALQDLTGGEGYRNDFYVFAFIAPTNYKFGESRSLIDGSLNNRGTSAETANNYGAYIGYEFSSQFSVRTGVSSVGITQRTGNVTLTGEDYTGISYANGASNTGAATALGNNPVTLRQKTSVIEVPLEATYAMFGTRADLYFKGGLSMFFMNENEVFAENSQGSVLLGSLKRANDFSLSGNAGIGFYYKFLRELQLNVEPGFKYYFNTFEGVNPISLYAQAGLLYRF